MIRTQKWEPDTHPGHVLHTRWDDEQPEAPHVCFLAEIDAVVQPEPQAIYDAVLFENQTKNRADTIIREVLPSRMKREVVDEDGDPTGELTVKIKHAPVWTYGAADGRLTFTIPGADDEVLATVRAALVQFGDAVTVG
ncbi:MAG: hypothetical protein KA105_02870 [Caulobacter sp.]|nr:hypothetical protein [Caulobacter sp.]